MKNVYAIIAALLAGCAAPPHAHMHARPRAMTSLALHDAAHLAGFMPEPMQQMGTAMHRAASRFAVAAQDAGATHDTRPVMAALAELTRQCVACHAAYRLQ